ncbi:MAG: thioredoxin family protein [Burkholderiaceae bacterium]
MKSDREPESSESEREQKRRAIARWVLLGLSAACAVVVTLSASHVRAQSAPASPASARPAIAPIAPLPEQPGDQAAKIALPYDEAANPHRDLQNALAKARTSGKRVLVVFGANWCQDCRVLDREFHAGGKTAELVRSHYELVKVDVGHFDKNLDFAKLYGEPIKKGIPSVVVVTPTNQVVYQTRAGELADARGMGGDGLYNFFKTMVDRPVNS